MRTLIAAWVCLLGSGLATAAPEAPDELVKSATTRLQHEISTRQAEFRQDQTKLYQAVDRIVTPHFDLRYITQLILARNWREATDDQRERFQVAFKNMLIRSYANALLEFSDSVKADWQPLQIAPDATDVTVESRLLRDNKPPVPVGFALRKRGDEWKVYDIIVEGLSLVTNFRSQVAAEIRRGGIEALITKLESGQGLAVTKSG
jgi:phospholipid transport system substrate-binding protein